MNMNYLKAFTLLLAISLIACKGPVKEEQTTSEESTSIDQSVSRIEVIDFYGTHRCVTCEAIEANAKFTVDNYFSEEQEEGKVIFKTVNVDLDENYNIAARFQATGTALFIHSINKGQKTQIDLTAFAFQKGLDKEEFSTELKAKIEAELIKL